MRVFEIVCPIVGVIFGDVIGAMSPSGAITVWETDVAGVRELSEQRRRDLQGSRISVQVFPVADIFLEQIAGLLRHRLGVAGIADETHAA